MPIYALQPINHHFNRPTSFSDQILRKKNSSHFSITGFLSSIEYKRLEIFCTRTYHLQNKFQFHTMMFSYSQTLKTSQI